MAYGLNITSGGFLLLTTDTGDEYENIIETGTGTSVTLDLDQDLLYVKPPNPSSGNFHIVTIREISSSGSNTTVGFYLDIDSSATSMDYIIVGKNSRGTLDTNQTYGVILKNDNGDITLDSRRFEFNKGFEPIDIIQQGTLTGGSGAGSATNPTFSGSSANFIADLGTYINMNWSSRADAVNPFGTYRATGVMVSNGATSTVTSSAETGIYYLDRRTIFFGGYQFRDQWSVIITGGEFTS